MIETIVIAILLGLTALFLIAVWIRNKKDKQEKVDEKHCYRVFKIKRICGRHKTHDYFVYEATRPLEDNKHMFTEEEARRIEAVPCVYWKWINEHPTHKGAKTLLLDYVSKNYKDAVRAGKYKSSMYWEPSMMYVFKNYRAEKTGKECLP